MASRRVSFIWLFSSLTSLTIFGQSEAQVLGDQRGGSADYQEAIEHYLTGATPKIVGGAPAAEGQFPWQVSLDVSWIADPYSAHFCGGSVYSKQWIVTAAHCVDGNTPEQIIVTAGSIHLTSTAVRRNVKRIVMNRQYNKATHDFDIALLELLKPLPDDARIAAIPLLTQVDETATLQDGVTLTVTGWGSTTEGGDQIRDLRFVQVPLVSREKCSEPLSYGDAITSNMICAGVSAGGMDSCQGDSGGPLSIDGQGHPKLVGIVSWGEGCARERKPGIYTRVANFESWVAACVVNPNGCQ